MRRHSLPHLVLRLLLGVLVLIAGVFARDEGDKVPITTSSKEALAQYLEGRSLAERLRATDALPHFEKAVAQDPNFAMGYLNLAFAQPTAKGFFENLNKATSLVDKVSEGERLWILGVEAGVNGFPMQQRENYKKLVEKFPNDERAHTLLGNHYFGQQEYEDAIAQYEKALKINPDFSQPYNQLGYANRFLGNYEAAEKAFEKYITLIPDDPNPYDSYAELLMKMGRYDASIESYRKALRIDPHFVASYIGIATNYDLKGEHEAARQELETLYAKARNDGERRAALFATSVSYVDQGKLDKALAEMDKQFALAKNINDAAAMAGDLTAMGNILLEADKPDEAKAKYEKALKVIQNSDLSEEIKANAARGYLYNSAQVALAKNDLSTARMNAAEYKKEVEAIHNAFQIRLAHELAGRVALEQKNYDQAIAELQQANQQNPYTFYRIALAYEGKGDRQQASKFYKKAADFNALNNMNYAFIRTKAGKMVASK